MYARKTRLRGRGNKPAITTRPRHGGFTLIEVVVVVAIIGILVAIAYPSYRDSVQKSRRSDAKNAVMDAANRQEQYILDHKTYTTTMTDLGFAASPAISEEGYYSLVSAAGTCGSIVRCFKITATARGAQLADTGCRTFVLQSTGARTATKSGGASNSECW